ncbi:GntR family transcriptional regulator [Pelagibius sp. CAU 1746]|uniref:GntR family transcriptional regulator n=1 Tax=Pelagibius sp. CAU 1746 TaxID=3140370 RepID=UPI00325AC540
MKSKPMVRGAGRNGSFKGRPSLHDELVATVRDMILEGELAPGTRIPEVAICEQLGVSRTPLREALKVLASEGLVVLLPRRGSMVSEVSVEEISAVFEVMASLEALIGELIVERATEADIAELDKMHAKMMAAHSDGNRTAYFRQNQKIHYRLASLARNPVLESTYETYSRKIMRGRSVANLDQFRWDESAREHEGIMEALRKRNGRLLAERMKEHSELTAKFVVDILGHHSDSSISPAEP